MKKAQSKIIVVLLVILAIALFIIVFNSFKKSSITGEIIKETEINWEEEPKIIYAERKDLEVNLYWGSLSKILSGKDKDWGKCGNYNAGDIMGSIKLTNFSSEGS